MEGEQRAMAYQSGTLKRAIQLFEQDIDLDPDSADVISLMGLQLDNRHLRSQAWERAIKLDPDHAVSYYRYAVQKKTTVIWKAPKS